MPANTRSLKDISLSAQPLLRQAFGLNYRGKIHGQCNHYMYRNTAPD